MRIVSKDWDSQDMLWYMQDRILVTAKTTVKRTKMVKADVLECERVAGADGAYKDKMYLPLDLNDFNEV